MADAHTKPNHDYHLVNPSPWPIIGSIGAFLMALGGIMWMKGLAIGGLKAGGVLFIIVTSIEVMGFGTGKQGIDAFAGSGALFPTLSSLYLTSWIGDIITPRARTGN